MESTPKAAGSRGDQPWTFEPVHTVLEHQITGNSQLELLHAIG